MGFYAISAEINALTSLLLIIFILKKGRKSLHRAFAFFAGTVFLWSQSYFFWQISNSATNSLFFTKLLTAASAWIPSSFFYFSMVLIGSEREDRVKIRGFFITSIFFCIFSFTDLMVADVRSRFGFQFWPTAGSFYWLFIVFYVGTVLQSHLLMYKRFSSLSGLNKEQIKYVSLGTFIGFIGGATNFLLWFDINIPPFGNILVSAYVFLTAYAVIRYRLMDIRVAISSAGIFIFVYAIALGVPVYFYYRKFYFLAFVLLGVFATLGPSLYLYLQRRANDILLKEQRRYQQTLIQASSGMGRIKDLKKLLKLIVRIVMGAIKPEYCSVYLYDRESKTYILNTVLYRKKSNDLLKSFPEDSKLIEYILTEGRPILLDEIKTEKTSKIIPSVVALELASLGGEMIVPSIIDDRMVAFLALGQKSSGTVYTADDINVFTILANQSALAIENAQFYEDVRRTQEQLFKAEKMATIGTMADGLSHQINNRFHAMGFVAGDMQDTLDFKKDIFSSEEALKIKEELCHGLERIQENVKQGGEIVRGLLKYTRHTDEGVAACDIDKIFNSAYEIVQFKVKSGNMKIDKLYDLSLIPQIKGNFTQLQEVFFNLIDNAYDAMMQRKTDFKEEGYQPTLSVSIAEGDVNTVQVIFSDNGMGVKDEDRNKLFTPFFTTKATSKKGTGLGLYVIRKIVEDNHGGKVEVVSKYQEGTKFLLSLPKFI